MTAEAAQDEAKTTARVRPPQALQVVFDPDPEEIGARIDWSSWYLTDEEDMGEGCEQNLIIWILRQILTELARERGWEDVFIGADQFFAWVEEHPLVRVSPDVFLLDDPPPRPLPASWQTWREGHRPPRLAIEIVSEDWEKDYKDNPPKYAQLGTRELVIFDPEAATGLTANPERVALQMFRHEADGAFLRVFAGAEMVRSDELDAWLVVCREGDVATLSIARDPEGLDLVLPIEQAREQAEQACEQAEHREREERAAREEAERKLSEALAKLEKLERGS